MPKNNTEEAGYTSVPTQPYKGSPSVPTVEDGSMSEVMSLRLRASRSFTALSTAATLSSCAAS